MEGYIVNVNSKEIHDAEHLKEECNTDDIVAEHKEHARRFARGLERAVQYLRQNPAEERRLMEEFFKLPKLVVDGIVVNDYSVKVDAAGAQIVLDALVEDGMLKGKVNFAELLHDTAK